MNKSFLAIVAFFLVFLFNAPSAFAGSDPLSVSNGVLMKNGAPYRAIGFNYYDSFNRYLLTGDTSYIAGFQQLSAAGVPFIRFQVLPFYPNDARPYVTNMQLLYTKLDKFIADAASYNIALVPCVFFNLSTVPDIKGEPVSAWGTSTSQTRIFASNLASGLAHRYVSSPTIWMWEFSNETNDHADVPTGYTFWPISVASGTPASRTTADNYTSAQLYSAYSGFAGAIRASDPTRLVTSGHNVPLYNAYNLALNGGTTTDSQAQFNSVVLSQQKIGDVVSMHTYPIGFFPYNPGRQRFNGVPLTIEQFLPAAMAACTAASKPLFIGEYGTTDDGTVTAACGTPALSFTEFKSLTNTIVSMFTASSTSSGLAAPWVYDFSWQDGARGNYSVTSTNPHANRLALVAQANQVLQGTLPFIPPVIVGPSSIPNVPVPITNGSFEAPVLAAAGTQANPSGAVWSFTGASGIQSNANPTRPAPTSLDGTQVAYLQSATGFTNGTISQSINFGATGSYTLAFEAALMANSNGAISCNVLVDGVVVATFAPATTASYSSYITNPFTIATAGSHTVQFAAVGTSVNSSIFIDALVIADVPSIPNASFETPALAAAAYQYYPTGASWTFFGASGVANNGSAWHAPTAPDGTQAAFLQMGGGSTGSIYQSINVSYPGARTLSFQSALRPGSTGAISFNVTLDGTLLGNFAPTSTTSFAAYTIPLTITEAGNHTLQVTAVGLPTVNSSVFMDKFSLK